MAKNNMTIDNNTLSGLMFLFVFLVHLTRVFDGWDIFIGPWLMPVWVSYIVILVAGYLTYHSFEVLRK
jgi:hypothetical protein|tara:strand:+ start:40 stop:243 length:204 start_codon:yes stop_codon:yes gene_type:complete